MNLKRNRENRLYNILNGMKQRCYNPKNNRYKDYGGRGIDICNEWLEDSLKFMIWSYENGYSENLTIDRIDVNKGYSPENCRWITAKEQMFNTTRNVYIEKDGLKLTLTEWANKLNINPKTLDKRRRLGWSDEDILKPVVETKGSGNGNSKLTEEEVIEIKRLLKAGFKGSSIARKFNVSKYLVSSIKTGKTWNWLK